MEINNFQWIDLEHFKHEIACQQLKQTHLLNNMTFPELDVILKKRKYRLNEL